VVISHKRLRLEPAQMTDQPVSVRKTVAWKPGLANYLGLIAVLAVLIGLFSLLSEHFFSVLTFRTLANQVPSLW